MATIAAVSPQASVPCPFGVPFFRAFHIHREDIAQFNRIHAIIVALVNHLGDAVDIVVATVSAQCPGWFVLHTFHPQPFVWSFLNFNFFLAGHRASMASGIVDENIVVDKFAANLFRFFTKGGYLAVHRRQRANRIGDVHQDVGAINRKAALARAGDVGFIHDDRQRACMGLFPAIFFSRFGEALLGLDDDGFQIFAAANGSLCHHVQQRGRLH